MPGSISTSTDPAGADRPGPPSSAASANRPSWLGDHLIMVVAVVFFLVFAFVFQRQPEVSEWTRVYYRAAHRMSAGEPLYLLETSPYAYPPLMALVTIPLSWMSPRAGLFVWYLINVGATCVTFVGACRLAGVTSLIRPSPRLLAVLGLGMLLCLRFFITPLTHQQFDMVIAALLFTGCCQIVAGRDLSGAALLGAAAAMKCTPLLLAPYLVWRGRFRAAAVMVVVAAGLNLLPDWLYPQASGNWYMADWFRSFLSVAVQSTPGQWFADWLQNQSLSGMVTRLAYLGLPLTEQIDLSFAPSPGKDPWLRVIVHGLELLLLGITAWRLGRPGRTLKPANSTDDTRWGVEIAALLCLMLLLSPMTSKAHMVVMILPSLLVARAAVEGRRPAFRWLIVPLLLTGTFGTQGLLGPKLSHIAMAWSLPTWYVLITLGCMWAALGKTEEAPDPPNP